MRVCSDGRVSDAIDSRAVSESDLAELRAVAVTVAQEAAAHVRRRRAELFGSARSPGGEGHSVQTKSTDTDPVTIADTESEDLIRTRLGQLRPGDGFLGEESGGGHGADEDGGGVTGVQWVVDPIDGTVNFVYGIAAYAVSVAARIDGVSVAGAVVDVAADRLYSAAVGLGATCTGADGVVTTLRCTPVTDLGLALVATGFSYSATRRASQGKIVAELLPQVRDIRRIGAAALDLCMVASGSVDAHYEHGLNPWDWAAGALIASEAGAEVRLPTGFGDDGEIMTAAAPGIAEAFAAALTKIGAIAPLPD
ncbi:inositol monophosphatase [Rhodococcus sp. HNM0563]|uniref:inositol monophosphatase family protein n=1 Tax=unclassified Rhodococcus (in: high G+C Gram-positive bacteria) TaxID=192944 RepID=UPI00146C537A|nr:MULTISPECIES: inositol monophosphatase family protein [unclassified Rhodococcus (in: high G+C Gram-positive bacteria)]MCK0092205.1 inositol monophosphatase [Rhodococcus sp. F64268]NLU63421.1 inositol monophosphatase [Rhodococcus sp. HNM0563]